jgi:serine/threonine protein phosphatase 1
MIQFLRSLFSRSRQDDPDLPRVPRNLRVYAIGDIHGRLDLFDALAEAIEADDAAQIPSDSLVILLGDLIDRGPDSAGVIEAARWWQQRRSVRILTGNHEEMFLKGFESVDVLRHFLRHGGKQTIMSFGVPRNILGKADVGEAQALMQAAVPETTLDFIRSFEDTIRIGDYLFVHAGVDPAVPLDSQRVGDLRWIREPFLSHPDPYGAVVVHGHTISDEPQDRGNRIGIDTGAYASGRLTALVLEGATRRYIEAAEVDGVIHINHRPAT